MGKDRIGKLEDYHQVGSITGSIGAGIYKLKPELVKPGENPDALFFVKSGWNTPSYIAGNVARLLLGESAPEMLLLKDNNGHPYMASRGIENFKEVIGYLRDAKLSESCWPNGCIIDDKGRIHSVQSYMLGWMQAHHPEVHLFEDSEKVRITAGHFLEHGDMHGANLGIRKEGDRTIAAVLDFDHAFNAYGYKNYVYDITLFSYYIPPGSNDKVLATLEAIMDKKEEVMKLVDEMIVDLGGEGSNIKSALIKNFLTLEREITLCQLIRAINTGHPALIKKISSTITDAAFFKDINGYTINELLVTLLNSGNTDLTYKFLPYMPQNTLEDVIGWAIDSKHTIRFNQLLPYVKPNSNNLRKAFMQAIEMNDIDRFNKIFEHIKSTPIAIEKTLETDFEIHNTYMLDKMLPYMNPASYAMQKAFEKAVELNDTDKFNKIFERIKSSPSAMHVAFKKAFEINNRNIFDKMLPYMNPGSGIMKQAFEKAVESNDTDRFNKMLEYIDPFLMGDVFEKAVESNDTDRFNKIFEHIKSSPSAIDSAFTKAFEINNRIMFDKMLPYANPHSYIMKEALDKAIEMNDIDEFNKIFEYISPSAMGDIFKKAVERNDVNEFNKIFERIKSTPDAMVGALGEAIKNDRVIMLDQMLPYMRTNSPAMSVALEELLSSTNEAVHDKVLDFIKSDSTIRRELFAEAFERNEIIFKKLLPYIAEDKSVLRYYFQFFQFGVSKKWKLLCKQILMATNDIEMLDDYNPQIIELAKEDGELFINMLEKAKVNNLQLVKELQVVLPEMLENPDLRKQLLETATKTGNQEVLAQIQKGEVVNLHMDSTPSSEVGLPSKVEQIVPPPIPESTIHSVQAIAPMIADPKGQHEHNDTRPMSAHPDLHGTLMLAQVALGLRTPSAPVKVEMPSFVEMPAKHDEPKESYASTLSTGQTSHDVAQSWLQAVTSTTSTSTTTKKEEDDEIPKLVDDTLTIHTSQYIKGLKKEPTVER